MIPNYVSEAYLIQFIQSSLEEDLGEGDHSSLASIRAGAIGNARLLVKANGVLAGVELAKRIISQVDPTLRMEIFMGDGEQIKTGDIAFALHGSARSLLATERLVLNCMQRMSGIATMTRHFVDLIKGSGAQILDTRKTTPTLRPLEKWAVLIGGGTNHRMGLYDRVMLKDNHIRLAGGIEKAILSTKAYLRDINKNLTIEIEVQGLDEVREVLRVGGIDTIMFDNMSPTDIKTAVGLVQRKFKTEASGGIHEGNVLDMAKTGVDFISIGALTHSYKSLDLSLKIY